MFQRILVPVLLVALVALVVVCARSHAPEIQGQLETRARIALLGAGFSDRMVRGEGRVAVLAGSVREPAERDAAYQVVASVNGIRGVRDELTVDPRGPPGRARSLLRARVQSGRLYLAGRFASRDDLKEVLYQARRAWRAAPVVVEDLEPADTAGDPEPWPDLHPLFRILKQRGEGTDTLYRDNRIDLRGKVLSELGQERLRGAIAAAYPQWEVHSTLAVRAAANAEEALQVDLDRLLAGSIVEFVQDSDALTDRGRALLDRLVEPLRASAGRVEISGHTDSQGDASYNQDLSERRARNVKDYLTAHGVPPARLVATGHGALWPLADNTTPEGRRRNRRIEFRIFRED
ncbi:MAG: OmpA family protein [Gammaproteobacteria bacterium]|jgi:outer membrane protein OmpA-like peptidoglycan-associated protein|nr:OmpA family protein [Gammaproteobacteria bacterium]